MLDFSFSELLLIAIAAIVFIGPKEFPVVIRHAAKLFRELKGMSSALRTQMQQVMDEAGLGDLKEATRTTIIDLEGKVQPAYDVTELKVLEAPKDAGHE